MIQANAPYQGTYNKRRNTYSDHKEVPSQVTSASNKSTAVDDTVDLSAQAQAFLAKYKENHNKQFI